MRAIGLFAGVGGMELGFARVGIRAAHLVELDEWKRRVLAVRFPGVPVTADVRDLGRGDALPDGIDIVTGGFPCQDASVAGKRRGFTGARSSLWHEQARIVALARPRWVVVENVPGLLTVSGGRDFGRVLADLADLGYCVAWRVLDARFFGVAQRRRRVFLVGHLGAEPGPALHALFEGLPGHPGPRRTSWQKSAPAAPRRPGSDGAWCIHADALGRSGDAVTPSPDAEGRVRLRPPGLGVSDDAAFNLTTGAPRAVVAPTLKARHASGGGNYGPEMPMVSHALTGHHGRNDPNGETFIAHAPDIGMGVSTYRKAQKAHDADDIERWEDDVAGTVSAHGGGLPASTIAATQRRVRRLTPVECERLMGWPDDWTAPPGVRAPDSKRYAACGDGVVANVAEWVAAGILTVESES